MAVSGLFTFEDLYGGNSPYYYHHRSISQTFSSIPTSSLLSVLNVPITTTAPTIVYTSQTEKLISSTKIESITKSNKLADLIPFTYFYWVLVVLAILLTLTLIIFFICYCRTFVKNYRNRRDSLSDFYRHQTVNRYVYTNNIYQQKARVPPTTVVPPLPPLPAFLTPPCPSKSLKSIDDQLYRQNSEDVISPPIARHDVFLKEPLSTFASSTSNSPSAFYSQLSSRSSDPPLKVEQLYESQRASMELNVDEFDNDLLIVDIN